MLVTVRTARGDLGIERWRGSWLWLGLALGSLRFGVGCQDDDPALGGDRFGRLPNFLVGHSYFLAPLLAPNLAVRRS